MQDLLKIQQEISENKFFDVLYKKALLNHQSFRLSHKKHDDAVIQNITQKIAKQQSQEEGLILLHCYLTQCSLDVIEQKGAIWATTCLKICSQNRGAYLVFLSYEILGLLLEKSTEIPELGKAFCGNYVGKICEMLRVVESNSFIPALKCLSACLKIYPGSCGGSSRNVIEKVLIKNFIDCSEKTFVKWSARCFHLLQQVKGGAALGNSPKMSWEIYQLRLIGSLHSILDLLFANCFEYYDYEKEEDHMFLDPLILSNEPVVRIGQLTTRFKNLVTYLIVAIREPFSVSKAIQPKKILNLISRGLNVTCDTLKLNLIFDNIALGAILPDIQVELYGLLTTLILVLKNNLNIYHGQILGLIVDSLKWTSSGNSEGLKKPYSDLRVSIYNTLAVWCQTMKYGSCCELVFEQLFKQISNDITPFRNEIMLQVSNDTRRHISKKIRRQLQKTQNERSHLAQVHMNGLKGAKLIYNDAENKNVCFGALAALKYTYTYSSCFVKPLIIKEVQDKIINICLTLFETRHLKTSLYANSSCRERIYDSLSALAVSSHYLCPPPISIIIQLLIEGQTNDYCNRVRRCCTDQLIFLEKVLHPQKHSLYFPTELTSIKNAIEIQESSSDSEKDLQHEETLAELTRESVNKSVTEAEKTIPLTEENFNLSTQSDNVLRNNILQKECDESLCEAISVDCEKNVKSLKDVLSEEAKAIPCPKKRILQNLQKCSEDDELNPIQTDVTNASSKRIRIESEISEIEYGDIENNAEVGTELETQERKNLFEEILATFTNELNEE